MKSNVFSGLDRRRITSVQVLVTRFVTILAILALVGACGSKDKKDTKSPGSTGTVGTEDMSDKGPIIGDDVKTTTGDDDDDDRVADSGDDDDDATGDDDDDVTGDDDDDATGDDDDDAPAPEIKLPNHDLKPSARKKAVKKHVKAARAALESNNADKAIEQSKLALDADPASVDAVVIMAHAYYFKNLDDTAEILLDDVFKRDKAKKHAGVFYVYGLIYDRAKKYSRAFVNFKKAVDLDGDHTGALINAGKHYLRNKQYKLALSTYKHVVNDLDIKTAVTWTNLGSAYRGRSADVSGDDRNKNLRKAESSYAKAQQIDKAYGPAYYNRAILYLDAEPFPMDDSGTPMDKLQRLERAKTYLDKYRETSGSDRDLVDDMTKLVNKRIKREKKAREPKDDDWDDDDDDDW
jgi:tetratricopeptide (TPR) repeat protein